MVPTSVYLDTNVIIAIMESASVDNTGIQEFWRQGSSVLPSLFHTSEISLAELLVLPYRRADHVLVRDYVRLFSQASVLTVHGVNRSILDVAAVIRSRRRMKLPDAIHLATASVANCSYFMSFDSGIADLNSDRHPFFEDVVISPVKIVRPDPTSLAELSESLS